jgi:hypothetical protein
MNEEDTENWMATVHVRDHALEKAIMMVRFEKISVAEHLTWAKHYWDFLRDGSTPLPTEMTVPDDLSTLVEPPEDVVTEIDMDPLELGSVPPWQPNEFPGSDLR